MKSPYFPFDDAEMIQEQVKTIFRGEEYLHYEYFWRDPQGHEFTTAEMGDKGLNELYDAYRRRHGIATTQQIKELRLKCGLSASKMSRILGFGPNQYRLYEAGAVPNESNGKLLSLLSNSNEAILFYINLAKSILTAKEYEKAILNIK